MITINGRSPQNAKRPRESNEKLRPARKRRKRQSIQDSIEDLDRAVYAIDRMRRKVDLHHSALEPSKKRTNVARNQAEESIEKVESLIDKCSRQVAQAIASYERNMLVLEIEMLKDKEWWSKINLFSLGMFRKHLVLHFPYCSRPFGKLLDAIEAASA